MIKVNIQYLEGKFAVPLNHPPTCANDPPWMIHELKIEDRNQVWIRGVNTMWFPLASCIIGTKREMDNEFDALKEIKKWT